MENPNTESTDGVPEMPKYNFQPQSLNAKKASTKKVDKLKKGLDKLEKDIAKPTPVVNNSTPVDLYKKAWHEVYAKKISWQKEEIDAAQSSGDTDNRFFNEFIQQVVSLAENPPQETCEQSS